jgi:transcriptional antiterminator NusG
VNSEDTVTDNSSNEGVVAGVEANIRENSTDPAASHVVPSDTQGQDADSEGAHETDESNSQVENKLKNPDLRWYVVHVHSGFEMKAKQALEERVRQSDLCDLFGEVKVPQETVIELVRGQKKTANRKFLPGYIMVEMVVNEDTWHLVNETPKISGFIGNARDPSPLDPEEVARVFSQAEEGASSSRSRIKFEQGDTVKVIDGPFTDFNGTVEEAKPDKGKIKVLISIFGRATPVELDFVQVEKV